MCPPEVPTSEPSLGIQMLLFSQGHPTEVRQGFPPALSLQHTHGSHPGVSIRAAQGPFGDPFPNPPNRMRIREGYVYPISPLQKVLRRWWSQPLGEGCWVPLYSFGIPNASSGLSEVLFGALHTAGIPQTVADDVTEIFLWQMEYGLGWFHC